MIGVMDAMAIEEAKYNVLESWIKEKGLTIVGDPIWARYNPPFTPWFLRRNEILIPINTFTN